MQSQNFLMTCPTSVQNEELLEKDEAKSLRTAIVINAQTMKTRQPSFVDSKSSLRLHPLRQSHGGKSLVLQSMRTSQDLSDLDAVLAPPANHGK